MLKKSLIHILSVFVVLMIANMAHANNLTISNISVGNRNPQQKTVEVGFDISWQNSWKNKINHDAAWIIVRLQKADGSSAKELCQQAVAGLNPTATSVGSNAGLEIYIPADKIGAFIRRKNFGAPANVTSSAVKLPINYASCGFADNDQVTVSVHGLEMVFVPQGAFFVGDNATSQASLVRGSSDNSSWVINSESAITVTNPVSGGYRYVSASNPGEFSTGTNFVISANYPKGYGAFYAMKYEVTEGQWVDFINSLPSPARLNRDLTDNNHKNSDNVVDRNTIACSGVPLVCATQRPWRAIGFLSWPDLAAFLDWWGLRPMTELEFEKLARGVVLANAGEYAWGTSTIVEAGNISANEDGTETITTSSANSNIGNQTLTGGDASGDVAQSQGPLRVGIFAIPQANREISGGGFFGAMELTGNLSEWVVTIGNTDGLLYISSHGDGFLTSATSFEGNATNADWPGINPDQNKGVTASQGSGLRGGSYKDNINLGRISDRTKAATTTSGADASWGGRGVRTYDGS